MKKRMSFVFFLILFLSFQQGEAQLNTVHLSYNIIESESSTKKYLDDNGCVHFYIGQEHFKSDERGTILDQKEFNNLEVIAIKKFIELSNKNRENQILAGERKEVITVLSNSEVFETIFLYEKKEDTFFRYRVSWIDEIVD